MYEHQIYFQRTHNGQLGDHEEIFAEFDKRCTGLESLTLPLIGCFVVMEVGLLLSVACVLEIHGLHVRPRRVYVSVT